MSTPTPGPVERKVTAATVGAYLAGLAGLAVLNGVADTNLISVLPDLLEVMVAPLFPAGVAFLTGYIARHTPR